VPRQPGGHPGVVYAPVSTFTPNRHTLMFSPGDVVVTSISDPPQGFTAVVRDLTTHQTGFMTASAANGFMNPLVQYETDAAGSENLCTVATGVGCTVPPIGAKFYPFWSLSPLSGRMGGHSAGCVWNFGNDQPNTLLDFGKDAQYGTPNLARYGGTLISAPAPNPQFTGRCRG
jgi:hypothetical protein